MMNKVLKTNDGVCLQMDLIKLQEGSRGGELLLGIPPWEKLPPVKGLEALVSLQK